MKIEITYIPPLPDVKVYVSRLIKNRKPLGHYTYREPLCYGIHHTNQCDCDEQFDNRRDNLNSYGVEHER